MPLSMEPARRANQMACSLGDKRPVCHVAPPEAQPARHCGHLEPVVRCPAWVPELAEAHWRWAARPLSRGLSGTRPPPSSITGRVRLANQRLGSYLRDVLGSAIPLGKAAVCQGFVRGHARQPTCKRRACSGASRRHVHTPTP